MLEKNGEPRRKSSGALLRRPPPEGLRGRRQSAGALAARRQNMHTYTMDMYVCLCVYDMYTGMFIKCSMSDIGLIIAML